MRTLLILLGLLTGASIGPSPALACGPDSRCEVEGGYYLASPPPGWDGTSPLGLVVYFHGWNASPEGTFRNHAIVNGVNRRGALFVAPYARTGYWRQIGLGRAEPGRDEKVFIESVMADIRRRWPIHDNRTLASGFSRGASMVWNIACYAGDLFRAYAPIAGGFWTTTPDTCPSGPVDLRHIHGRADRVVAFDRVGIYNSMPIPEGLEMLRRLNGNERETPVPSGDKRLDCTRWSGGAADRHIELCRHSKGHSIPAEWVAAGYRWMLSLEE